MLFAGIYNILLFVHLLFSELPSHFDLFRKKVQLWLQYKPRKDFDYLHRYVFFSSEIDIPVNPFLL